PARLGAEVRQNGDGTDSGCPGGRNWCRGRDRSRLMSSPGRPRFPGRSPGWNRRLAADPTSPHRPPSAGSGTEALGARPAGPGSNRSTRLLPDRSPTGLLIARPGTAPPATRGRPASSVGDPRIRVADGRAGTLHFSEDSRNGDPRAVRV